MGKIIKLSKDIADKIAAGEVVERPVSVVKELVENAIDAGSDSVTIEIKNGGKSYIRVSDNGSGIQQEDLQLVFERHATSKIKTASDLESIWTLGFRGEALSSISAVSKIELITKTVEARTASRLLAEAGEICSMEETGAENGTTIIVTDLFYNTPARRKFLKTDGTEASLIIDLASRIALCYPKIRIRLVSNSQVVFSTNGKGDTYQNILSIYGKEIAQHLLYAKDAKEGIALEAYLSGPELTKSTRRNQYYFVNGRTISSKLIEIAVQDGYREKMFEGRYPVVFLFLTVDPASLDVNIHPSKREIKFENEGMIRAFIADALRNALYTRYAVPEIHYKNGLMKKSNLPVSENSSFNAIENETLKTEKKITDEKGNNRNTNAYKKQTGTQDELGVVLEDVKKSAVNQSEKNRFRFAGVSSMEKETQKEIDVKKLLSTKSIENQDRPAWIPSAETQLSNDIVTDADSISAGALPDGKVENVLLKEDEASYQFSFTEKDKPFEPRALKITGSIFATYITASDDTYFYLIDQHAAHERVFYEQLLSASRKEEKASQMLLQPFVFEVTPAVKAREIDWIPVLESMSYVLEEFGQKSYAVKEIPAFMDLSEARAFIDEFADRLEEERDVTNKGKLDRIITQSCKSAVKANDQLDPLEMKQLLEDLSKCENPFSCPHGRPVFLKLSKVEIEHLFKRK